MQGLKNPTPRPRCLGSGKVMSLVGKARVPKHLLNIDVDDFFHQLSRRLVLCLYNASHDEKFLEKEPKRSKFKGKLGFFHNMHIHEFLTIRNLGVRSVEEFFKFLQSESKVDGPEKS